MKVTFDECICIRYYEYDRDEEYEEKRGRDWQVTTDLTCREFKLPIEKGGCGGDWNVLQSKLDKLDEPYWYLIGQLWQKLHPFVKRIEEEEDSEEESDDSDSEEESDDSDSEEESDDSDSEEESDDSDSEEDSEKEYGIGCNKCYACVTGGCGPCIVEEEYGIGCNKCYTCVTGGCSPCISEYGIDWFKKN